MSLSVSISDSIKFICDHKFQRTYPKFMAELQRDLEIPNPEFIEAERLGRWTGRIPRTIRCYERDRKTNELRIPRGYKDRLFDLSKRHGVQFEPLEHVVEGVVYTIPQSQIELRDYQSPAVGAAIDSEFGGVIVAPPGAGKTEMGLEILVLLGCRTLWITHKQDLAVQVRDRAIERLGMKKSEIGMIGGGKERIGDFLTIGLIQTLSRRDLSQWANLFGVIVVDECHHVPAVTWKKIVSAFPARYRFGLTGTLERQDGLHAITHLYLGPVIHEISAEQVREAGGTITPRLKVVSIQAQSDVWKQYEDDMEKWNKLFEELTLQGKQDEIPTKPPMPYREIMEELLTHTDRNAQIVANLAEMCPGHSNLVLTSRVAHAMELRERLEEVMPELKSVIIHHQMGANERQSAIQAMRDQEVDVMFAVDIPKEGLDIPCLDRLYFVAGGRDPIMVKQSIGRIQRSHPGKDDCLVTDFVDFKTGVLRAQYYRRRKIYVEMGIVKPRQRVRGQVELQASA